MKFTFVCRFSLFAKNHPSLFAANDEAFRGIHEQYTKKLDDMIKVFTFRFLQQLYITNCANTV